MRLIDADALMIELLRHTVYSSSQYGMGIVKGLEWCQKDVNDAPTIKAEPVRHGRWELINTPSMFMRMLECSACKGRVGTTVKTNYCPNCGAKMDGGI